MVDADFEEHAKPIAQNAKVRQAKSSCFHSLCRVKEGQVMSALPSSMLGRPNDQRLAENPGANTMLLQPPLGGRLLHSQNELVVEIRSRSLETYTDNRMRV